MRIFSLLALVISAVLVAPCYGQQKNPVVLVKTNMGDIKIELNAEKAPITVKNFMNYVKKKHYDGKIFHRVISDFMIQGGGMDSDLEEAKTDAPIKNESFNGLSNERGTIAMARTTAPNSATAQFFINVKDNKFLDGDQNAQKPGYAVFGKVIDGMDVVDKIRNVKTKTVSVVRTVTVNGQQRKVQIPMQDVPVEPVVIQSVREVMAK